MEQPEIHHENPYPNVFLWKLEGLMLKLFKVYRIIFDTFLGCLFHTTKELQEPYKLIPVYLFLLPLSAAGVVIAFPYLMVVFSVWYLFQWKRKPFRYSYTQEPVLERLRVKPSFTFMTTNLCLLPESMAKFNNLDNSLGRSSIIGRVLANGKSRQHVGLNGFARGGLNGNNNKTNTKSAAFDVSILTEVDPPDFLFIQEGSWVLDFGYILGKELHKVYPYIIHDVCKHTLLGNLCLGTSGLMFASKYPLMDVQFRVFKDHTKQCSLASKGLLHAKVYLGNNSNGQKVVGFLYNTHLQAYQGTKPIQSLQMSEILKWAREYRLRMSEPNEVVAFDVLGGDFNLDNLSPVDRTSTNHDLFQEYKDVGRVCPGRDQDWAVGTEFRQRLLYDPQIISPGGLKFALEDPTLLQTFMLDADVLTATTELGQLIAKRDEEGNIIPSPFGGKRRIDYLLFKEEDNVEVVSYNFVTQLARLTDHLPVFMELRLASHKV